MTNRVMFTILPRSRIVASHRLHNIARAATSTLAPQTATSRHAQSAPTLPTQSHSITLQRRLFSSTKTKRAPSNTSKIAVVGAGEVGSTVAYSLILNPVASQILLVDPKEEVRDAQVADLSDATYHGNTTTQFVLPPRPTSPHTDLPSESALPLTKRLARRIS